MDVSLIQAIERDFDIIEGNTFDPYLDFFNDDKTPFDISGSSFIMTIRRKDGRCCFGNTQNEVLTIGNGLVIKNDAAGNTNNRLQVSKILQSEVGHHKQDITWTNVSGRVSTVERGNLEIVAKA